MTQEIRANVAIKSTTLDRSGLRTKNMTSTTPDHQEGTSWKNVQVDENGNFVTGTDSSAANNGLNVDADVVVLWQDVWEAGDPAKLLSDREIPTNGFNLSFNTSSSTDTQIKDNGDVIAGGARVVAVGDSGDINNVTGVYAGVDWQAETNLSLVQQAAIDTSWAWVVLNSIAAASGNVLWSLVDAVFDIFYKKNAWWSSGPSHTIRWARYDGEIKNLIGSSPDGKYFLSETGWRTWTALVSELPQVSNASTDELLTVDTATGQLKRLPNTFIEVGAGVFNSTAIPLSYSTGHFDYHEILVNLITVAWLPVIAWRKWIFIGHLETTITAWGWLFSKPVHSYVFATKNGSIGNNWLWILGRSSSTSFTVSWSVWTEWMSTNSHIYIDNVVNGDNLWVRIDMCAEIWGTYNGWVIPFYSEIVGNYVSIKI